MSNLAEKIEQTAIALDRVRRDGGTQMRDAISEATVIEYAEHIEDGAEFPAVTVFYDGTDYWLADGFHRCAAYERAGVAEIPAEVLSGTHSDAIAHAIKANATNGRPRTLADLRRAYSKAVEFGLCEAHDSKGVAAVLLCSTRHGQRLTQAAREEREAKRNAEIERLAGEGRTHRDIADVVGVHHSTVQSVVGGKRTLSETRQGQSPELDPWVKAKQKEDMARAKEIKRQRHEEKSATLEGLLAERTRATATGDLTLGRGSAFETFEQFEDGSIDLLITDPPYSTDVDDIESFSKWLGLWLPKVASTGRAYVFIGAYPNELRHYLNEAAKESRLTFDNVLVWTYRNTIGPSPKTSYKLNWQACLYFHGPDAPALDCPVMTEQFTVQDVNAPDARTGVRLHAWQKPDELAERLIRHSTTEGQLVVDPFVGTGTFVSAASRLGRNAAGFDTDETMLGICERRGLEVSHAA